jgi:hypothetical protein
MSTPSCYGILGDEVDRPAESERPPRAKGTGAQQNFN